MSDQRCSGISTYNGKQCGNRGKPGPDGLHWCGRHNEVSVDQTVIDSAALLAAKQRDVALRQAARAQAEQAYAAGVALSNRTQGMAHGRTKSAVSAQDGRRD